MLNYKFFYNLFFHYIPHYIYYDRRYELDNIYNYNYYDCYNGCYYRHDKIILIEYNNDIDFVNLFSLFNFIGEIEVEYYYQINEIDDILNFVDSLNINVKNQYLVNKDEIDRNKIVFKGYTLNHLMYKLNNAIHFNEDLYNKLMILIEDYIKNNIYHMSECKNDIELLKNYYQVYNENKLLKELIIHK